MKTNITNHINEIAEINQLTQDQLDDTRNYKQDKQDKQNKQFYKQVNYADKKLPLNEVALLSLGQESSSKGEAACPQVNGARQMPKKWRTVKLDLFNNTKDIQNKPYDYHLKINIYLYEKCEQNNWDELNPITYGCKFNDTSLDSFNIDIVKSDPHYAKARQYRDQVYVDANQLNIEHMSLNKLYRPSKNKKLKTKYVRNFSGMLIRTASTHIVTLFCGPEQYDYVLSNLQLTQKQRRANIIASATIRAESQLNIKQEDAAKYLF